MTWTVLKKLVLHCLNMFTGIIEGQGLVTVINSKGLTLEADFDLVDTGIGDSIAVNGACLTVTNIQGRRFKADLSPATLDITTFRSLQVGEHVNLERALKLGDRLDGHFVSGHIDGTGKIDRRTQEGNAVVIRIKTQSKLMNYIIPKGSITLDGISLTINKCHADYFIVSIIPHSASFTTITSKPVGAQVNIETDMIAKYIERLMHREPETKKTAGIDLNFLAEAGFL